MDWTLLLMITAIAFQNGVVHSKLCLKNALLYECAGQTTEVCYTFNYYCEDFENRLI